jgi:hypothetical protein
MLSSVLSSERAILVNIAIVRTFIRLRTIGAIGVAAHEQAGEIRKTFETME